MSIREFAKKQEVKNFYEGIVQQASKEYAPETIQDAEQCFYDLFKTAEKMSKEDVDAFLCVCLGFYILEAYNFSPDRATVKPKE